LAWTIEYTDAARKQLRKLDRATAQRIYRYLAERVAPLDDARDLGKALSGPLGELWRYRVGDYRVIAELRDNVLTVLVLRTGHRRDICKQRR
jgi:mRNA interferase RelE/StbE